MCIHFLDLTSSWYDRAFTCCVHKYSLYFYICDPKYYVTMTTMASQITSLTVVYSIVYSGADQRKHQSSASLAFVRGIHRTGEFPAQRASNAENASIWWRHHVDQCCTYRCPAPISVNSTADPVLIIGWCIDGTNFRWISRIVIKVIWLIHSKQQGHSFTYMD